MHNIFEVFLSTIIFLSVLFIFSTVTGTTINFFFQFLNLGAQTLEAQNQYTTIHFRLYYSLILFFLVWMCIFSIKVISLTYFCEDWIHLMYLTNFSCLACEPKKSADHAYFVKCIHILLKQMSYIWHWVGNTDLLISLQMLKMDLLFCFFLSFFFFFMLLYSI